MNMRSQLLKIVEDNPKNYSQIIKRDTALFAHVNTFPGNTISEKVFQAITPTNINCPNRKQYKFRSLSEGYKFCGRANTCRCAKQSVSEAVAKTKASLTEDQVNLSKEKRKKTNLKKYGVENAGQTPKAIQAHKEAYTTRSEEFVEKVQDTKQERYGDPKYNNIDKIKETNQLRYGAANVMQNNNVALKSKKNRTIDYSKMYEINYRRFKNMIGDNFGVTTHLLHSEYKGIALRPEMMFECLTCSYKFKKRFDYASPPICKICNPTVLSFQSNEETAVFDYVQSLYDGNICRNTRSVINPYEIDIWIPDLNIAIEYCGLYWHSEISGNKTWKYHFTKYDLMKQKGIRLITIFSDEWNNSRDIVKSKLKTILGKQSKSIGARQTVVKEVSRKETMLFHDTYHIQGSTQRMSVNIGLVYNGRVCAIATFLKKSGNEYELTRFSSSVRVVGGMSKIIKYFRSNYSSAAITSFSDNRWSEGDMYKALGFDHVGNVPPMQSYVEKYSDRHHKRVFNRKKMNIPGNITEWQFAQDNGYDRIWDCGKKKWVLTVNS